MKFVLRIVAVYIGVALLITVAKTLYNLWAYWSELTVIDGLSTVEAIGVCITNGLIFGIPLAALILVFLGAHSVWTMLKVWIKNKRVERRKTK